MRLAAFIALLLVVVTASPVHGEVEEVEHYDSLPALTRAADAVVLGQVVAAQPGRSAGGCRSTSASLRVDELLAGSLPPVAPVLTLEYFGFCALQLPGLGDGIPAERGVFFLRNKGRDLRIWRPGASDAEVAAELGFWRLAIMAGTAVDRSGLVHVPEARNAPWLAAREGTPFEAFVAEVRAAAPVPPASVPEASGGLAWIPVLALTAGAAALASFAVLRRTRRDRR